MRSIAFFDLLYANFAESHTKDKKVKTYMVKFSKCKQRLTVYLTYSSTAQECSKIPVNESAEFQIFKYLKNVELFPVQ